MTIKQACMQLERSERGQKTCKLLLDFLKSSTVQGLDGNNEQAVAALVTQLPPALSRVPGQRRPDDRSGMDRGRQTPTDRFLPGS